MVGHSGLNVLELNFLQIVFVAACALNLQRAKPKPKVQSMQDMSAINSLAQNRKMTVRGTMVRCEVYNSWTRCY